MNAFLFTIIVAIGSFSAGISFCLTIVALACGNFLAAGYFGLITLALCVWLANQVDWRN